MAFTRATGKHRRPGRAARTTRNIAGIAAATGVVVSIASPALAANEDPAATDTGLTRAIADTGDRVADNIVAQADAQEEAAEVAAARAQVEEAAVKSAEAAKKKAQEAQRKAAAEAAEKKAAAKKKATEERASRSDARTTLSSSGFVAPIAGSYVSTPYKASSGLWSSGSHSGIDFHAASGTAVHAVGAGTVVEAGWGGAYGNNIVLKMDDGTYTQYGHLSSIGVSVGQKVSANQQIGLSGSTGNSTGPHLHFEARTGPDYGSDIDPVAYLRSHGVNV
ncbi:M23 family metallopeptidase [Streptomyces purpurogeneiscleroticus]|uniref:M23 family metallopeptidase n=1 Tax=Streptomyces purpurogeneiscleroticus TaxID=68259 RepID=UPI001CBFD93A|nr:M23 family metallopeptidase [Streptomyces purpurogeneiscleroticus]MBZ4017554.1 peptidase [Streptomyces purpurogeneiscleroticus]